MADFERSAFEQLQQDMIPMWIKDLELLEINSNNISKAQLFAFIGTVIGLLEFVRSETDISRQDWEFIHKQFKKNWIGNRMQQERKINQLIKQLRDAREGDAILESSDDQKNI